MGASAAFLLFVCQLPGPGFPLGDIQATLDALPPDARFQVPSGSYGRTVLRTPMTLVGADPAPSFTELVLEGSSGGQLKLVNMSTSADLTGQGFEELFVFEFEIAANRLHVDGLRYLEATHLTFSPVPFGHVEVPGASVLLLDSFVGSLSGARLYRGGSTCFQVNPTEFEKSLANDLVLSHPVRIGGPISLSWSLASPVAVLFGRNRTQRPLHAPRASAGYWHLAGTRWLTLTVVSPGSMVLQVPPDPLLIGFQTAFQLMGPNRTFSRPASAVVR